MVSLEGQGGCLFCVPQCFVPPRPQRVFEVQLARMYTHTFSFQQNQEPLWPRPVIQFFASPRPVPVRLLGPR